jgi:hypothetical protein
MLGMSIVTLLATSLSLHQRADAIAAAPDDHGRGWVYFYCTGPHPAESRAGCLASDVGKVKGSGSPAPYRIQAINTSGHPHSKVGGVWMPARTKSAGWGVACDLDSHEYLGASRLVQVQNYELQRARSCFASYLVTVGDVL